MLVYEAVSKIHLKKKMETKMNSCLILEYFIVENFHLTAPTPSKIDNIHFLGYLKVSYFQREID